MIQERMSLSPAAATLLEELREERQTILRLLTQLDLAILGKALEPLDEGTGMIMVQVALR